MGKEEVKEVEEVPDAGKSDVETLEVILLEEQAIELDKVVKEALDIEVRTVDKATVEERATAPATGAPLRSTRPTARSKDMLL